MRITVFAGSSNGVSPAYREAAARLGEALARRGVGVVFGGGHVGLMGALADAALAAGGEVIGVMPRLLVDREIAHRGLTRLHVVDTMHQRKAVMAEQSDAFVALPGGAGTLEELFEAWTWQQIGFHAKPVVLYDVDGYWEPLLDMLDRMVEAGFVRPAQRAGLPVVTSPAGLLAAVAEQAPPSAETAYSAEATARRASR